MRKIILDTNVLISGIFFSGPPYPILDAWRKRKFDIVVSHEILQEYKDVFQELSLKYEEIDSDDIIELISVNAKVFLSIKLKEKVTDDPDDEKFIACAIASKAKIIISGDKHLLKVNGYKGISVIKPKEFLDRYIKR